MPRLVSLAPFRAEYHEAIKLLLAAQRSDDRDETLKLIRESSYDSNSEYDRTPSGQVWNRLMRAPRGKGLAVMLDALHVTEEGTVFFHELSTDGTIEIGRHQWESSLVHNDPRVSDAERDWHETQGEIVERKRRQSILDNSPLTRKQRTFATTVRDGLMPDGTQYEARRRMAKRIGQRTKQERSRQSQLTREIRNGISNIETGFGTGEASTGA